MRKLPIEIDDIDLTKILVHYIKRHPDKVQDIVGTPTIIDDKVKFEIHMFTNPMSVQYYTKNPYKRNDDGAIPSPNFQTTDWLVQDYLSISNQNCINQIQDEWDRKQEAEDLLFGCLNKIREEKIDSVLGNKIDSFLETTD